MNTPEYHKYTLDQLYDSYNHIDKERYPENYNALVAEIERRKLQSGDQEKKSTAEFITSAMIDKEENSGELTEIHITNYKYVAYILFVNAFLIIIQSIFFSTVQNNIFLISMITDVILGTLLFTKPSKVIANILIFRAVLGLIVYSYRYYIQSQYLQIFLQFIYSGGIIYLLTIATHKRLRNIIFAFTIAIQITLVILVSNAIYVLRNLDSLYSVTEHSINMFEGEYYEYKINIESENWYLRNRNSYLKENAVIDQWAVNIKKDAHILVIGETFSESQKLNIFSLKDAALSNTKKAATSFKEINSFPTENDNHDGLMVHAKATVNLREVEYLYGFFVIGDKAFQVVTFCGSENFNDFRELFINTINSFHYCGKINEKSTDILT